MLNVMGLWWFMCSLSPILAATTPPALDLPPTAYERLLERYISGDYGGAVEEAVRRPARAFEPAFEQALANADYLVRFETTKFRTFDKQCTDRPDCTGGASNPTAMYRARDELVRLLLAAMLLHTEAALKTTDREANDHIRLALTADAALVAAKRHLQGKPPGARHFTTADVDRARHDWVVLVAVSLHARARLDNLEKYLANALKRYPRDPALELCLGVYYERRALADTVDVSLVRELYPADHEGRWRRLLERGIAAFGEAARASELSQEAHLRIGHTHAVLGDLARARSELEPLKGGDRALPVQYLALLTLGAVDEAEGRRDAAEARYRDANSRFPTAQAPMLAVSRLHDEAGDTRGAAEWMERSFALPADGRVDPWWSYYSPFIDLDAQLTSLRQQVHR